MTQSLAEVFRHFKTISLLFVLPIFATVLTFAEVARSQSTTGPTGSGGGFPGPAARENNRSMDEYDRAINRMKNDAKAVKERRLNLFPQINDDFQHLQIIHNEIVRMVGPDKGLNYDRLADLTNDMKKRSVRLRENLLLPEPDQDRSQGTRPDVTDEAQLRKTIAELHELVVTFVSSPIFKNLGVVDAKVIDAASKSLGGIINVSDEIKRDAKLLSKSVKK